MATKTAYVLNNSVLMLNKSFLAVNTCSIQKAIKLVQKERAQIVSTADTFGTAAHIPYTWEEWSMIKAVNTNKVLRTHNKEIIVPEIIRLCYHDKPLRNHITYSRINIFKRDHFTCQYCGAKPGTQFLNIDHVIPRCKGGQTTWENVVLSCFSCNTLKGSSLMHEVRSSKFPKGMSLAVMPVRPKARDIKFSIKHKSWKEWLDSTYWNIELENQN